MSKLTGQISKIGSNLVSIFRGVWSRSTLLCRRSKIRLHVLCKPVSIYTIVSHIKDQTPRSMQSGLDLHHCVVDQTPRSMHSGLDLHYCVVDQRSDPKFYAFWSRPTPLCCRLKIRPHVLCILVSIYTTVS